MRPAEVSRIADGSSDVCSSDLVGGPQGGIAPAVVKSSCPGTSSQSRRVVDQRLQLEGGKALSTQHPQPAPPGLPRFRRGEQASSLAPASYATTRPAPLRCDPNPPQHSPHAISPPTHHSTPPTQLSTQPT